MNNKGRDALLIAIILAIFAIVAFDPELRHSAVANYERQYEQGGPK